MKSLFNLLKKQLNNLTKKGAPHILLGNFATKFVTFFGSVFLARLLSKTDLGVLSYMENLCSYAYLLLGLGMSNAILRYNIKNNERTIQKGIVSYSVKRGLISDCILIAIVISINAFYPYKGDFLIAKSLVPILILALPFQDVLHMVQMNERSFFANKRYAVFSVGSAFLIVVGRMFGAWKDNLWGVVISVVIVNIVVALLIGFSSYNKYFKGITAQKIKKTLKKEMSIYSLQYMITNGLWGFFMLIDVFLLGYLLEDAVIVADYKIAYAFPANMAIFSSAVGIFVASYFIKHENDNKWVRTNYKKLLLVGIIMQGIVGLLLFVFAKPLIWLYGSQYYNVIPLMRILIVGYFIETAFRASTANILASMGKVKYNMIISAGGLILQIILDVVLIPLYGAYGIAYVTIIVRLLMSLALFLVFNRMYKIVGNNKEVTY